MSFIVSHTSPDWDSIGATWLLMKYGGEMLPEHCWPVFVNTGNPDPLVLEKAAAVLDTGRVYDPDTLRFDHHQDAALKCATVLVADCLTTRGSFPAHLFPLIDLIHAGDTGAALARSSAMTGLHAMLGAYKRLPGKSDRDVLEWGCEQLDLLDAALEHRAHARYRNDDF